MVQALIASLAEHLGIARAGSGPCKGRPDACLASLSASTTDLDIIIIALLLLLLLTVALYQEFNL
jgi:hypothetical protein